MSVTRFHGGQSGQVGRFATTDVFDSRKTVREKLALPQQWGNRLTKKSRVDLPPGTKIWKGKAAPQFDKNGRRLPGGGDQVFIEGVDGKLDPNWFKGNKWFRSDRRKNR